ncbi:hypothetical protein PVAP13_3KG242100 [Panicum virgatum]|uniref:Uncharacterized protein n=1 Tax=Panicum virgatum TaxID=38727 RepID=A0A8T0V9Z6_PANVG|nr:hypothetical protein PVAP13_3KG242100 [Panicum virgatum]
MTALCLCGPACGSLHSSTPAFSPVCPLPHGRTYPKPRATTSESRPRCSCLARRQEHDPHGLLFLVAGMLLLVCKEKKNRVWNYPLGFRYLWVSILSIDSYLNRSSALLVAASPGLRALGPAVRAVPLRRASLELRRPPTSGLPRAPCLFVASLVASHECSCPESGRFIATVSRVLFRAGGRGG